MPATTFDFIRKVKAFLMSRQISNSSFFAKINNNDSNHDSSHTYSTYDMLGTISKHPLYKNSCKHLFCFNQVWQIL